MKGLSAIPNKPWRTFIFPALLANYGQSYVQTNSGSHPENKIKKTTHKSQCILEPQSQGGAHLTAKQAGVYPGLECDIHSVKNKPGASKSAQGSGGGDGLHLRPGCCIPGSLGWESCRSVIRRGQDHCQLLAAFPQSYSPSLGSPTTSCAPWWAPWRQLPGDRGRAMGGP